MPVQVFDEDAHAMRAGICWRDQTSWPQRHEVVADQPRTPVGKVPKFKLLEMLAAGALPT